jgi:uncharacterized protein (TIGR03437 family)
MKLTIVAVFVAYSLSPTRAADLILSQDGITVYDAVNKVNWLADANLAVTNRFGLPLCAPTNNTSQICINANGSMNYPSALAWVAAMNAANFLGHNNWLLPTTPLVDKTCGAVGPNGGSFAYSCTGSAMGWLYYSGLGLKAPNSAVPIPNNTVGPFSNFQPYLYWSQDVASANGYHTFSFNTGWRSSNVSAHAIYALPMIHGKIPGTPAAAGSGLQVNPGGQTVYDPVANVSWVANANLAATNTFGLPACTALNTPKICVNSDGAMSWDSASQLVANMNTFNGGAGYLGQKNWELPHVDMNCGGYNCSGSQEPMGNLFYAQLGLRAGMSVVPAPNISVGPFHNLQPYLYYSCQANTVQEACSSAVPAPNFGWSFSFGNGFEGTDEQTNGLYVTAYYAGAARANDPVITQVANAEGESSVIAPNTWVEIKGATLSPAGDSRIWQSADFVNNQMPTQLDKVSATVNGQRAYVYYISPTQINILTPPDPISGPVQVVVTNNGVATGAFTAQAQPLSASFFVFGGGPYVAATHANGALLGPASLYPGSTTPAKPGETIVLYANGFGPTSVLVVSGSILQSGALSPLPVIKIGGAEASVTFAGLVLPGEFQFNVVVPSGAPDGDQPIIATYNGSSTQPGTVISVKH